MADNIRNNLQNVTIGGNYVDGNQTVHHHQRGPAATAVEANAAATPKEATVFLSYRRANSDEADSIDRRLSDAGLIVKRDIRDISPWQSIRAFMQSIRDQDVAVLLVSDAYLKSHACMYEIMEIMKEKNYQARILPVVIEHDVYNKAKQIEYIAHWQHKAEQYKTDMLAIEPENQVGMPEELRQMKHIAANIGEFLQTVADMNNPDISDAGDAIIATLKQRNLLPQ
ncbi:toll/interleukin-1 receptor domain-containing protein [Akkermansia glycaniphila]|uniref:toll/interleukin-1 receptor domain-containing protein n=1 Tax=Akkermansia glycaniphila TaxID=1679444 RepID=UPI001C0100DA|nr:toll/interleukin-1 receptor domain-containing protein [Akkermansia glycaniphila]MBT9449863.1 toll/interleukin-1 receptor domain-containing protein [Akkermansia glycaniphila]